MHRGKEEHATAHQTLVRVSLLNINQNSLTGRLCGRFALKLVFTIVTYLLLAGIHNAGSWSLCGRGIVSKK